MAVASLVLGILALITSVFTGGLSGLLLGVFGAIFGIIGRKDLPNKSLATAGLVLSLVSLFGGFLFVAGCLALMGLSTLPAFM